MAVSRFNRRYYAHAGALRDGRFTANETWGPYFLDDAESFARVTSKDGSHAIAITCTRGGDIVRVYDKGVCTFPKAVHKPRHTLRPAVGALREGDELDQTLKAAASVLVKAKVDNVIVVQVNGAPEPEEFVVKDIIDRGLGTRHLLLRRRGKGARAITHEIAILPRGVAHLFVKGAAGNLEVTDARITKAKALDAEENPAALHPLHERFEGLPTAVYAVRYGPQVLGTVTKIGPNAYRASAFGADEPRDFVGLDDAAEWVEKKAAQQRVGRRGAK
jgi:hypothetical protein